MNQTNKNQQTMSYFMNSLQALIFLYPLERIQTNMQIKHTYISQEVSKCKEFFTRCTHYGIRSWFRGLTPYVTRVAGTFGIFQLTKNYNFAIEKDYGSAAFEGLGDMKKIMQKDEGNMQKSNLAVNLTSALPYLALGTMYTFLYPLQNIKMRMCADIERKRTYTGIRDCSDKIRKIQGTKTFYRGYLLALPHLFLQYGLTTQIYKKLVQYRTFSSQQTTTTVTTGIPEFLISFITSCIILHPLDSIKKIIQINGAMSHQNKYLRYRDVLQMVKISQIFQGFWIRVTNGILYTTLLVLMHKNITQKKEQ